LQIGDFLDSDTSAWSAACCKLLPQCEGEWRAVVDYELNCGLSSIPVREQHAWEAPPRRTVVKQFAASQLFVQPPSPAVADLLFNHVQHTTHELDVQLEMLPPSLHATLCACHLSNSTFGNSHLALDVSHAAVLSAAAAVLPRLPGLDSLELIAKKPARSISGPPPLHCNSQSISSFMSCLTDLKRLTLHLGKCAFVPCHNSLTALQFLDLRNSDFVEDTVLQQMSGLANLRHLSISECSSVTDQGLKQLRSLIDLQHLDLGGCEKLTDQGIVHLSGLIALQYLSLTSCPRLTNHGLQQLSCMTALQHLDLGGCINLADQGIVHLSGLIALRHLDLSYCARLTNHGLQHLSPLTALQHLELSYCKNLTGQGLRNCEELSDEVLDQVKFWSGRRVTNLAPLCSLAALTHLNLRSCASLTDQGLRHLSPLTALQHLDLRYTDLTGQGLKHLGGLASLHVDLSYTNMSKADPVLYMRLTRRQH
jgi:hypothetical protein